MSPENIMLGGKKADTKVTCYTILFERNVSNQQIQRQETDKLFRMMELRRWGWGGVLDSTQADISSTVF